jgi:predicted ArsR family transcriptional regulator
MMPQQVWTFLSGHTSTADIHWWSVRDLMVALQMPESTIRDQLNRLVQAGKVEARYRAGWPARGASAGCFVFRRAP